MTTSERQLEAVIRGRVQGVGFRHFVWRRASELGLHGEVRNRPDGSVAVVAVGPEARLIQFLDHLRRGPSSARVADVQEQWGSPVRDFSSFEIVG